MIKESYKAQITGKFKDTIIYEDGRIEERDWDYNCIINDVTKLITSLFKIQSGYSGLNYWAVGSGLYSWDTSTTPTAVPTDTKCINEIGRVAIPPSGMIWLDGSGNPSATPTNVMKVTVTFAPTDCIGTWREFSLFGGNATSALNSGIAINHKNHGRIDKTNTMTIQRQIIFTFN